MRTILLVSLFMAIGLQPMAQPWLENEDVSNMNFYQVQQKFENYMQQKLQDAHKTGKKVNDGEGHMPSGYSQFKRWEYFWEARVSGTNGEFPNQAQLSKTMLNAFHAKTLTQSFGDWQPIGPFDAPQPIGSGGAGIGRLNCLAFHPTNTDTLWVGAPAGGIWKSTDAGLTWTTNTDQLPNLGVSSIAIDPLHPDTMYVATGDRVVNGFPATPYSYGVLKSVDGGETWNTTGLSIGVAQNERIGGVVVLSNNTQIVVAATRSGIQRSTDGGDTWSSVQTGPFNTIIASPQAPHVLFAGTSSSQGRVWRSKDSGATWTLLTSTLPTGGVNRVEIAVSPEDSNYVYAVYSQSNTSSFHSLYQSTDGGDTWVQKSTSPNILGANINGTSADGQGWYDLAITVSPTNKDQIYVGAVNIFRSNNGGTTWSAVASAYGQGGLPYVHADIHYLNWKPGTNELFACSDGGVFVTANNGFSWTPRYNGMNITQYYKISNSESNASLFLAGAQDNGSHRYNGSAWREVRGGDGMDNAINQNNNQIMFASSQYGNFGRSTNGGNSFSFMNLAPNGQGQWITPMRIDPVTPNIVYIFYKRLYKSTNNGNTWVATTSQNVDNNFIDDFIIAPSNNQYIYACVNERLYKSTNAGVSWAPIHSGLSGSNHITGVTVSNTDPNHIWISRTGFNNSRKVYESFNGGSSWVNITGSLPNIPANCILYENGSPDGVYVGTDLGVYYRDATMTDWAPFNNGLPNLMVFDLEINYTEGSLIAGTYARGVWKSPLISNFFDVPQADFYALPKAICTVSDTVKLFENSLKGPTSFQWSIFPNTFTYVNGTADTSRNPQVVFSTKGQYTITLVATNGYGSSTKVAPKYVAVGGEALPFVEDFEDPLFLEQWEITNADNDITWSQALISGTTPGNQAAALDFYNYSALGQKDALISPPLSFAGFTNINLTFDHAYVRYNATKADTLRVYISTDCGTNWTLLQTYAEDGTTNWATGANSTTKFIPTSAADWCGATGNATCKTISLNSYAGNDEVRIKFEGTSGFGNVLYIDNVNITGNASVKPTANFIGDTAGCSINAFSFYDVSTPNATSWEWSFPGGTPATSTMANPQVTYSAGGTYNVTLIATNAAGADTIVKTAFVDVNQAIVPTVSIAASTTLICDGEPITFTATATNAGANPHYYWYKNNLFQTSTTTNSVALTTLNNNDVVTCLLTPSEDCVTADTVISSGITITVEPLPTVTMGNLAAVCIGDDPFPLTGGLPAGGTYSGTGVSNNMFTPSAAGIGSQLITYTYTGANGCENSASTNIVVNNGPPKPTVTYTNFVLQANPVSTSFTYQWFDGNNNAIAGATSDSYMPTAVGDYSVQLTFVNGCQSHSDAFNVTQIGLDEASLNGGIKLYPNPVKNILHAEVAMQSTANVTLSIIDVTGKKVYVQTERLETGLQKIVLPVDNLANGVYILEINDGEKQTQQRFVKN